ncbi:MAG: hypothetical protein HYR51_09165 [Candidatus Rokubacteria bacterium]|nr:hypothetical protein [Candidatus Rokubacteria bacterium]
MRFSVFLLGGFRARLDTGTDLRLPRPRTQAIVAYLATRLGQPTSRETLATLLWGEAADTAARHSLRQTLFVLKRAMPEGLSRALVVDGEDLAFDPGVVDVDVVEFERAVAGGRHGFARAVELYRGDFLEGFTLAVGGFEQWLRFERERLHELALEALAQLLREQMAFEIVGPAIRTAQRLLALDPLQETTHRALMRLYARAGRRAAAMLQYQSCVDVLRCELGAEPEAATRAIYEEIRFPAPLVR